MRERPEDYQRWDGRRPVLVVAPHGGVRSRPRRPRDRINDLHSADVARDLARKLDASALLNIGTDRNDLDLNRISVLAADAPLFLAHLSDRIFSLARGGTVPLVLLVHGWHTTAAVCDVGCGLRLERDRWSGRFPTLSARRRRSLVEPLVDACAEREVTATVGLRYPAAHPDNAAQLFSGRHVDHPCPAVAAVANLAAAGRVDALQLELGMALRWPGRRREEFVALLADQIDRDLTVASPTAQVQPRSIDGQLPGRRRGAPADPQLGWAIDAALPDGSGVFVAAGPSGAGLMSIRLCLVRPGGPLYLFVAEAAGEGCADAFHAPGARVRAVADGLEVTFRGAWARHPSTDAFLDVEAGQRAADLVEASARLHFLPSTDHFGRLEGEVVVGGRAETISEVAVMTRGRRDGEGDRAGSRSFLTCGAGAPAAVAGPLMGPDGRSRGGHFGADAMSGPSLTTLVSVPLERSSDDGRRARVVFGTFAGGDPATRRGVYRAFVPIDAAGDVVDTEAAASSPAGSSSIARSRSKLRAQ